jgi:hypothetical protein
MRIRRNQLPVSSLAGEGNRTLVSSLGSWRSTIELHPRTRTFDFRIQIADWQPAAIIAGINIVRRLIFSIAIFPCFSANTLRRDTFVISRISCVGQNRL